MGLLLELENVAQYRNTNTNITSKIKLYKLMWYKWDDSQKYEFAERVNVFICGIQNVISKG